MPFKLSLSKKKQYNVVSKNVFVTSVELPDGTVMECTLSIHSPGQECLHNVCQKLGVSPHYFGLQFRAQNRQSQSFLWWVDLEAPLKKQLDKLALSPLLYFRVIYFMADDECLHDELMRYHFFLQLKTDILEGRLRCTPEQATVLAGYILQAEFGNYDPERHTSDYLDNFVLLPKYFTHEEKQELWERVIQNHKHFNGLPPHLAEISYIKEAQRADGYGQEWFPAKDSLNVDVIIKLFLKGIYIQYENDHPPICFLWENIGNLSHHKKNFIIECHKAKAMAFQLEDSTLAKYVWRIAVQHNVVYKNLSVQCISLSANPSGPSYTNGSAPPISPTPHITASEPSLETSQDSLSTPSPPAYRPAPDYDTFILEKQQKLTDSLEQNDKTVDPRIQFLESKLATSEVITEFESVFRKKTLADCTTASLPENIERNRFRDVLPYEENRVKLTPTLDNIHGYINASHIRISKLSYIAAQGPLSNTVVHFWQMIWEYRVAIIIMLTGLQEQGHEKCFPYWPPDNDTVLRFGDFTVSRLSHVVSGPFATSHLSLSCSTGQQPPRTVWHFQYQDWPDHSCPQDLSGFLAFMQEIDSVRRHLNGGQIVVHCSAGVGRSGVVILCDIMFYALNHNEPVDIPCVLTQLRMQRMYTVQTIHQYKFAYLVLIEYLKKCRLI